MKSRSRRPPNCWVQVPPLRTDGASKRSSVPAKRSPSLTIRVPRPKPPVAPADDTADDPDEIVCLSGAPSSSSSRPRKPRKGRLHPIKPSTPKVLPAATSASLGEVSSKLETQVQALTTGLSTLVSSLCNGAMMLDHWATDLAAREAAIANLEKSPSKRERDDEDHGDTDFPRRKRGRARR